MSEFFYLLFFNNDRYIGYLTRLFDLSYTEGVLTSKYPIALLGLAILVLAVSAYFIGSINFSIVISRLLYHDDIRKYGSHNAGATNMKRTFGMTGAVLTFLGDLLKGVVICLITKLLIGQSVAYLIGFFCIMGHCFPAYFKFRGGKGVATSIAIILTLDPPVGLLLIVIFVLIVAFSKYISLGSITAAFFFPILLDRIYVVLFKHSPTALQIVIATMMAILIIIEHHANIKRITSGTESKFSFRKKGSKAPASDGKESDGSGDGDEDQ